jgi:hypothetical protein
MDVKVVGSFYLPHDSGMRSRRSLNQKGLDRLLHVQIRDGSAGTNLYERDLSDTRLMSYQKNLPSEQSQGGGKV